MTRREPTPAQRQILDLLIEGHAPRRIAQILKRSLRTVKLHLWILYAYNGIDSKARLAHIELARLETYRRHPELIPFNDGDRAQQINEIPAELHARIAIGLQEHKKSWKTVARDVTRKAEQVSEFAEMSAPNKEVCL